MRRFVRGLASFLTICQREASLQCFSKFAEHRPVPEVLEQSVSARQIKQFSLEQPPSEVLDSFPPTRVVS